MYAGLPTGWGGVADGDETLRYVSHGPAPMAAGPEWVGYEVLAGVVRELLPLLLGFGIATAEDIRIETLAARLREEVASTGGVARLPALVSAWTRIGES
ncbi:MAG: hypothetical protein ACJ8CB_31970 [Ktedonobacteraceae bacterium]